MAADDDMRRQMDDMLVQRLEGIETELKQMREVLVKAAQLEERLVRVMETNARIEEQNIDLFRRISVLEMENAGSAVKVGWIERAGWAVATAAMGSFVAFWKK